MPTDSERACLIRLQEMDLALARMEEELPEDVRPLGAEARAQVAGWLRRIAAGAATIDELGGAMREISGLMDALTERLLFAPWDGSDGLQN